MKQANRRLWAMLLLLALGLGLAPAPLAAQAGAPPAAVAEQLPPPGAELAAAPGEVPEAIIQDAGPVAPVVVAALDALPEAVRLQSYGVGEVAPEGLTLPATLTGAAETPPEGGGSAALTIEGVGWHCTAAVSADGQPLAEAAFDPATPGEYTFTAALPAGYTLAAGLAPPTITVRIGEALLAPMALAGDFEITGGSGYSYAGNTLTITGGGSYTIGMKGGVTQTTTDRIVVAGVTADITLNGVSIDSKISGKSAFEIEPGAKVNLTLAGKNELTSGTGYAGLQVPAGAELAITAASTGSLSATSVYRGAGIGGGDGSAGGTVSIAGGTVTATGGISGGAGIGGGKGSSVGSVTISGGSVTATGIGGGGDDGGNGGSGGTVSITGGSVNAMGATGGAGIGGGAGGDGSSATGGSGGTVSITGGTVTATGGSSGAGIGGGYGEGGNGEGGALTITGGSVRRSGVTTLEADATNGSTVVYPVTLTAGNPHVAEGTPIAAGSISDVACAETPVPASGVYGIKDVKTDSAGRLCFWLPGNNNSQPASITAGGSTYTGSVASVTAGGPNEAILTQRDLTITTTDGSFTCNDTGLFTIKESGSYTITMAEGSSGSTTDHILVEPNLANVNITLKDVDIDVSGAEYTAAFEIQPGAEVALTLAGENKLASGAKRALLQVPGGATLGIAAASTGSLRAIGGAGVSGGAGIGGGAENDGGNVTISGGNVTAIGGTNGGAGIGGGFGDGGTAGGTVTITGGTVTATSTDGAGIGGGSTGTGSASAGAGGIVSITGGTVTATSTDGAGIGGGAGTTPGAPGTLTITGGSVRRSGGAGAPEAPATSDGGTTQNVYLTTLTVGDPHLAEGTAITAGSIGGVACDPAPTPTAGYGIHDVKTDAAGQLYFWLPENSAEQPVSLTAGGARYTGGVTVTNDDKAEETLLLEPPPPLTATVPGGSIRLPSDDTAPHPLDLDALIALSPAQPPGAARYTLGAFTDSGGVLAAPPALEGSTLTVQGAGKTEGSATLALILSVEGYADVTVTLTFEAYEKQAATVIVIPPVDITYGEDLGDPSATATPAAGATAAAEGEDFTFAYSYSGALTTGAAYGPTAQKPAKPGHYTVTATLVSETHAGSGSGSFGILPKTLAWGDTGSAQTRPYNGATAAKAATPPTLAGILYDDEVAPRPGSLAFAGPDAGAAIPVTAGGWGITGRDAPFYNPPEAQPPFAAGEITKAEADGVAGALSVQPGARHSYNLTALLPAAVAPVQVGGYTVAGVSGEGGLFATPPSDASVSGAALTLDIAPTAQPGQRAVLTIGFSSGNYAISEATLTVVVGLPVATSGLTVADKTYDGAPFAPGGSPTFTTAAGQDVSALFTPVIEYSADGGETWGAAPPVNAGAYRLRLSAPEVAGYTLTPAEYPFTIRPAQITVTAQDKTAAVGAALPPLTYTLAGLAPGEALAKPPTLSCAANMAVAGVYPIQASGAAAPATGNYMEEILYVNGALTVGAAAPGTNGSAPPTGDGASAPLWLLLALGSAGLWGIGFAARRKGRRA